MNILKRWMIPSYKDHFLCDETISSHDNMDGMPVHNIALTFT